MRRMNRLFQWFGSPLLLAAIVVTPTTAMGEQSLEDEVESLTRRLEALNDRLDNVSREAKTPDRTSSKWHLSGYMDAGIVITDVDQDENRFVSGKFNPAFHFQYTDRVFFESELEIETEEDGSTNLAIEYSAVNLILNDYATLVVGKWLSPVGQFQERLHPSWINKMSSAPVGFGHGGIQPLSDVGVQLRGAIPAGDTYFTYVLGVGNGPQGGHHGLELEGFGNDNNSNKAVHGRFGFFPMPNLEMGASFLTASAPGEEADSGPVTEGDFDLYGVDVAYTKGSWDIRVEYLDAELSSFLGRVSHGDATTSLIPATEWTAWYAQAAYRLANSRLEPVVRVGNLDVDGFFEGDGEDRIDVGINYWLSPSAVLRAGIQERDFDRQGADDERLIQLQFAYGF